MARRDLVQAISPSWKGTDKSKWDPNELSRPRAEAAVNVIFDSIAAALKKGEKVTLPIGTFEVLERTRPPLRRWFLKRVRVTDVSRKVIQFTPAEGWLEAPAEGCLDEPAAAEKCLLLSSGERNTLNVRRPGNRSSGGCLRLKEASSSATDAETAPGVETGPRLVHWGQTWKALLMTALDCCVTENPGR